MVSTKKYTDKIPTEDQEQIALVKWLNFYHIPFYHIPNGGTRNLREGRKFKLMGVQSGVPDICIPEGRKGYFGMYIELKRSKGGIISENQSLWMEKLAKLNHFVCVAYGCQDAIKFIKGYYYD